MIIPYCTDLLRGCSCPSGKRPLPRWRSLSTSCSGEPCAASAPGAGAPEAARRACKRWRAINLAALLMPALQAYLPASYRMTHSICRGGVQTQGYDAVFCTQQTCGRAASPNHPQECLYAQMQRNRTAYRTVHGALKVVAAADWDGHARPWLDVCRGILRRG